MSKIRVLFLCTGNSARSQMAEALLRKLSGGHFDVFSAGLEPKGVHPLTVRVLDEIGIDTSAHKSKSLQTFVGVKNFDFLITVCSQADEKCPIFPGMGKRLHWPFEDPAAFQGSDAEKLAKFREVRDRISKEIQNWLNASSNKFTENQ
jgi:arsenate reductase